MKKMFFIDYENVNRYGLDGVLSLSPGDKVFIYYSEKAQTMTFGLHRRIQWAEEKGVEFLYRKIKECNKNALDNQMMAEIQELVEIQGLEQKETPTYFYIISKDKDYQDFIKTKDKVAIIQCEKISERCDVEIIEKKKKIYSLFKGQFDKEHIDWIVNSVMEEDSRQKVNNSLQRAFFNKDVKNIMKKLNRLLQISQEGKSL